MKISFRIEYNAEQGDVLFITGSLPQLGEWEPLKAVGLVVLGGGPRCLCRWRFRLRESVGWITNSALSEAMESSSLRQERGAVCS